MYNSFTSLPPEEEAHFVVFEDRMRGASRSATVIGFGLAGAMFLVTLIIIVAYWAPLKPYGEPEGGAPPTSAPQ